MKRSRSTPSSPKSGHAIEFPELEDKVSLSSLRTHTGLLYRVWGWIQARQTARSSTKRLRVAETVSLGEKRFVAVVQVDGRHFLLAGGPTNIALLAQLDAKEDFKELLKKTMTVPGKRRRKRKQTANTASQTILNPLTDVLQKKAKTTRKEQPSKPTRKRNASPEAPANVPLMAQLNGTQAFSAVLEEKMTAPAKPPAKQHNKHNGKWTVEQNEQYT
jgi:flagellar biogenesis protein FliO